MAEGEFYNIEEILDRRMIKGKLEYKIKWEGYPLDQSTWEPLENLETAKELVAEYDQLHPFPKKKAKKRNIPIYTTLKDFIKIPHNMQEHFHVLNIKAEFKNKKSICRFLSNVIHISNR